MGLQANIDIFLEEKVTFTDIIKNLLFQWKLNDFGTISYMDNDDFDWQSSKLDKESEIVKMLNKRYESGYTVGIVLLDEHNSGGTFLFYPNESIISFIININREKIEKTNFTDFSYYIKKLFLALSKNKIIKIECCDII